jgi:hypothetical protein
MTAPVSEQRARAFSLIEVVIAVGVAATGLVVVLALLPGLLQQNSGARHAHTALGLPDAVTIELRRMAVSGFSSFGARAGEFTAESSPLQLVAAEDGTDLRDASANDGRPAFFLIELHRFPAGSPLSYNASVPFLALQARISWPYRPTGALASEVARENRQRVTFNVALNP